jgi:hypothetical protein
MALMKQNASGVLKVGLRGTDLVIKLGLLKRGEASWRMRRLTIDGLRR